MSSVASGIQHSGPAGSLFASLEKAAEQSLSENCDGFPLTDDSFVQPSIFINQYTEEVNQVSGEPSRHRNASSGAHKVCLCQPLVLHAITCEGLLINPN